MKRPLYRAFALIALPIIAFAVVACSSEKTDGDPAADVKPKVALIMKSLANEFFVTMAAAAEDHQAQRQDDYELIVNGIKNESDLAQQVALVEQMVGVGVDAIVIAPADSKALVPVLARAREKGIHVVNIDNRLDGDVLAEYDLVIPFIGPNNRKGAREAAAFALEQYPDGANVVILEGVTTAQNAIDRRMGFEDAVEASGANLVTMQSAAWDQTKAAEVTAAILVRHPEAQVILAANDNMALGAASAVSFADLDHHVAIVGFDNISAVQPLLEDGRVLATVEQYGDQFAVNGIELALDLIDGQSELVDRETPLVVVTPADLDAQSEPPATP
ncbi:MAG: sugar ABC transporter substrate-binding protein [Gammaproteobacteria bacterium]|nr:sugar ABC transporter substrate-binding protein [Gammaproteobacteria bacterium]